ncbi:MAG: hypothetical protein NTU44_08995 [Bacteroidetes bacterium]|nr:hypothetical protein [Bacteroidota bacterium]
MELTQQDEEYTFLAEDGSIHAVPRRGSLGLLAYGYEGLKIWREVRIRAQQKEQPTSPDDKV